MGGIVFPGAEFDDDVDEQAENDNEDQGADLEYEVGEIVDDGGGSGARLKDIRDGMIRGRGMAQAGGEQEPGEEQQDSQDPADDRGMIRIGQVAFHFRFRIFLLSVEAVT